MKKNLLQGLWACCLLIAATDGQAQLPTGLPDPGEVILSINAEGGKYQQLEMPLLENDQGHVILAVASVNDDPQWGPTSNLCVLGTASKEQVCLRFSKVSKDAGVLTVKKVVVLANGKALLSSANLPGSFRIGEKIKVDINLGPDSVKFRINDGEPIVQSLSFAPRILRMGCSSAICAYRLQ